MAKGGYRKGAGGKPTWKYGKTKPIRVPVILAEKILEFARFLDERGTEAIDIERLTVSNSSEKLIDLSGITIRFVKDGPAVYLADLINAGYEIRPSQLMNRRRESSLSSLKKAVDEGLEQLKRLESES
jgi:hypothetical protein